MNVMGESDAPPDGELTKREQRARRPNPLAEMALDELTSETILATMREQADAAARQFVNLKALAPDFDIPPIISPPDWEPLRIPPPAPRPEIGLLQSLVEMQATQNTYNAEMAAGIRQLAVQAEKADRKAKLSIALIVVVGIATVVVGFLPHPHF